MQNDKGTHTYTIVNKVTVMHAKYRKVKQQFVYSPYDCDID